MTVIQFKRGLAATWASVNPILSPGEFGYETDTGKLRLGDGTNHWLDLPDFPVAADKGAPNGYAALDGDGLVPLEQLPITTADWATLDGKPAVVAAGATQADARSAIDAEYTGNKGQPNGYASLNSSGLVPTGQIPPGLIIDGVTLQDTEFQFTSGGTPIGDPISLLVATLDGGSPTATSAGYIDGGTV